MLASLAPELDADRVIGNVCMPVRGVAWLRSWTPGAVLPDHPPPRPGGRRVRPPTHPGQLSSDHPPADRAVHVE